MNLQTLNLNKHQTPKYTAAEEYVIYDFMSTYHMQTKEKTSPTNAILINNDPDFNLNPINKIRIHINV